MPGGLPDLLLDIEGTTTSISFVYDVLFPFARERLKRYLSEHGEDPELMREVADLRRCHREDRRAGHDPPDWDDDPAKRISSAVSYLQWLMEHDRKSTPLKSIQGRIWKAGYQEGDLQAHVFPDVVPAFERWKKQGRRICIFSSGSVLAQKLLFGHSVEGDLRPFLTAYFDTRTGPKGEASSYREIARQLDRQPGSVLFLSDVAAELNAAARAGMQTRLCLRPGNNPQPESDHGKIRSFDEMP